MCSVAAGGPAADQAQSAAKYRLQEAILSGARTKRELQESAYREGRVPVSESPEEEVYAEMGIKITDPQEEAELKKREDAREILPRTADFQYVVPATSTEAQSLKEADAHKKKIREEYEKAQSLATEADTFRWKRRLDLNAYVLPTSNWRNVSECS